MATIPEPKEHDNQTKEEQNNEELQVKTEKSKPILSTDFSSQESIENELDKIRVKINNPELRQSGETKNYLKNQEKLLLKSQKLQEEKKALEDKTKQLENKLKLQKTSQKSESKNYLLLATSGIILIGGVSFLGYNLFKKLRNKNHGKRK